MKKIIYGGMIVALILLTASISFAKEEPGYIPAYEALLSKYIQQGERDGIDLALVDYDGWAKDALHEQALAAILKINPNLLSANDKKAFFINAYNLLTVDLILKTKERESIKNQGSIFRNVWKSHSWVIGAKKYTLDQIEHQILRKMGDPRIHTAINCASLSCPDLPIKAFVPSKLDEQLDQQMDAFLQNTQKGVQITPDGLKISKIFQWFAKDFGGKKGVVEFIQARLPQSRSTSQIAAYLDYNWALNKQ